MKTPRFSVIVPSYNRARFLPEMIESVRAQNSSSVEIVVIDDGSTDNTAEICARHPDLVTYRYQENMGISAARNAAIRLARGELISFLDSDDMFLPGKFAMEEDAFARFPEAEVVSADSEKWLEGKLVCPSWFQERGVPEIKEPQFLSEHDTVWVDTKICGTSAMTARREVFEKVGLFDLRFHRNEDLELWYRIATQCRVLLLPGTFSRVRRFDDGSRVGRPVPGATQSTIEAYQRMLWHYRAVEVSIAGKKLLRPVAERFERLRGNLVRGIVQHAPATENREVLRLASSEARRGALGDALFLFGSWLRRGICG